MTLEVVTEYRLEKFKVDIKEAFRFGAAEGMGTDEEVLPEEDLIKSLSAEGAVAYAVIEDGNMLGGAIVNIDEKTNINHLDFLYVKVGQQGKKDWSIYMERNRKTSSCHKSLGNLYALF